MLLPLLLAPLFRAAAAQESVFKEMCLHRWMADDETCARRWNQWLAMRNRENARRQRNRLFTYEKPEEKRESTREEAKPFLALGIVSSLDHDLARLAMRETWLKEEGVMARFFVASTSIHDEGLVDEIERYGDVRVMNWTESYSSTVKKVFAIFRWGLSTGAHYVARANDDVYLRLRPTMMKLYDFPPSRIYAGHFVYGARPTRADDVGVGFKSWAVSREDYPANIYPTFAQGNAYILSRDLAEMVASSTFKALPDDVLTGLVVDAAQPRFVDVPTDYEFEGRWTRCTETSLWHFNLHYEHMYDLHSSSLDVRIDVDSEDIRFDLKREPGLGSAARTILAAYPQINVGGCSGEECLANELEAAWSSGRCDRIPDKIFCCG